MSVPLIKLIQRSVSWMPSQIEHIRPASGGQEGRPIRVGIYTHKSRMADKRGLHQRAGPSRVPYIHSQVEDIRPARVSDDDGPSGLRYRLAGRGYPTCEVCKMNRLYEYKGPNEPEWPIHITPEKVAELIKSRGMYGDIVR